MEKPMAKKAKKQSSRAPKAGSGPSSRRPAVRGQLRVEKDGPIGVRGQESSEEGRQ